MLFASSTVMTPSLPTLSTASAISLPMVSSLLAEMLPTWEISFFSLTGLDIFLRFSMTARNGLLDAALQVHGVRAGGYVLHAFA